MIYTDGIHLVTDQWAKDKNIRELQDFARKIHLKMSWLQDYHPIFGSEKGHPHFDLTTDQATRRALRAGAKMVSQRQLVCVLLTGEINGTIPLTNEAPLILPFRISRGVVLRPENHTTDIDRTDEKVVK